MVVLGVDADSGCPVIELLQQAEKLARERLDAAQPGEHLKCFFEWLQVVELLKAELMARIEALS